MIEKINISIWTRNFELPVNYNCYEGEKVTSEQEELLKRFLEHPEWIEKAKELVETHCRQDVYQDDENQKKNNLFSYIKPTGIFVKHSKLPKLAIMCKYRYDIEHGIAIVFDRAGKATIGSEDIIL